MNPTHPFQSDATPLGHLDEGPLARILGYQLAQATVVTQRVFLSQVGSTFELRPVEFTLLALVLDNPDVNARQLSRALAITPPNLVGRLEQLEKLEQLRALEHGIQIRVADAVVEPGPDINTPQDLVRVAQILERLREPTK